MNEERVELVVSAYRERGLDGRIRDAPAFHDLSDDDRLRAFEATVEQRAMEAALDADGLSATARAVLARIGVTR
jgi:hypothetical protein